MASMKIRYYLLFARNKKNDTSTNCLNYEFSCKNSTVKATQRGQERTCANGVRMKIWSGFDVRNRTDICLDQIKIRSLLEGFKTNAFELNSFLFSIIITAYISYELEQLILRRVQATESTPGIPPLPLGAGGPILD